MDIKLHKQQGVTVAELVGNAIYIRNSQDVLDILGEVDTGEQLRLIIHEAQLDPAFFNLRSGLAGDILQKFINYGVVASIVGEFGKYESQALRDLIYESNKGRDLFFTATVSEALDRLARV